MVRLKTKIVQQLRNWENNQIETKRIRDYNFSLSIKDCGLKREDVAIGRGTSRSVNVKIDPKALDTTAEKIVKEMESSSGVVYSSEVEKK